MPLFRWCQIEAHEVLCGKERARPLPLSEALSPCQERDHGRLVVELSAAEDPPCREADEIYRALNSLLLVRCGSSESGVLTQMSFDRGSKRRDSPPSRSSRAVL
ncbi:hypothetical protein TNCV_3912981 [Trichonephila clavipes]|nr:hypothetical protein TNCV_3912981 [Trichonephila clavipes]